MKRMITKLLVLPVFCLSLLVGCDKNDSSQPINTYNDHLEYVEGYAFYIDNKEYGFIIDTKTGNLVIYKYVGRDTDKVLEIKYDDYKVVYQIGTYKNYYKAHLYKYDYGYLLVIGD